MSDNSVQFVTIREAAAMLGVSRSHIYRLAKRGLLKVETANPTYAKGGPVRIPLAQVQALLARQP